MPGGCVLYAHGLWASLSQSLQSQAVISIFEFPTLVGIGGGMRVVGGWMDDAGTAKALRMLVFQDVTSLSLPPA